MKLLISLSLCMFLAACGGKKSTPATDPNTPTSSSDPAGSGTAPTTGDGQPCSQEIAMVCGEGMVDACLKTPPEGDTHRCVAP